MVTRRGKLIFPMIVELAQLDTAATAADPDAGGPLTSGYHSVFREPRVVSTGPDDQVGVSTRQESSPIQIKAQIEPAQQEALEMMLSGDSPQSRMFIAAHYKDLEASGLVDVSTGRPLIHKGDRLHRVLQPNGTVIHTVPNPPGLFVVETQDRGYGPGQNRNLLLIVFEARDQSTGSA